MPLSRGYVRETAVEREAAALRELPTDRFWARVEMPAGEEIEPIRPEAMVALARHFIRAGEEDSAWRMLMPLMERTSRTIARHFNRTYGLGPEAREELADALACQLYEEWLSQDPSHEFWEVRFGVCLKRRIIDATDRFRKGLQRNVSLAPLDDEGQEGDPMERIASDEVMTPEMAATVVSALDALEEPLRTAFYLYHYSDWSEEQIAQRLDKTSRTVRNYLRRAEKQLEAWRGTETEQ